MKNFLRERGIEVGGALWYTLVFLLVTALVVIGLYSIQAFVYPRWLSYQREAVENGKSYTDSTNQAVSNFIREYTALDTKIAEAKGDQDLIGAYENQQSAILTQICGVYVTMNGVSQSNFQFISAHGGCR